MVIEDEDIVHFLNVAIRDNKIINVSKEVAYEAILGHSVEPKISYLKKEMPFKFQLLHHIIVQCMMQRIRSINAIIIDNTMLLWHAIVG